MDQTTRSYTKYIIHAAWILAFIGVSIYGSRTFHDLLFKHYYTEAKAAKASCYHKVDELQIQRGAPYAGNPGEICEEIVSSFRP